MVLAGDVGGQVWVWVDQVAGPQLELEPVGATGLVAVRSGCPVTKDEWRWKEIRINFVMWDQYSHVHCWSASHSFTSVKLCTLESISFLQCPSEPSDNFSLVF